MFTGIIEEVGQVLAALPGTLRIKARKVLEGSREGDSIAVNGVCLTAANLSLDSFTAEIMPETARLTNLGRLRPENAVNLERALTLGGRLGGHLVQGHIDGTGKVMAIVPDGPAHLLQVSALPEVMQYITRKGFIAVDGVSLTIVKLDNLSFTVSLVGHTWENTILNRLHSGDAVNLEVDIIAKYVAQYCRQCGAADAGINLEFLREHGF